MYGDPWQAQVWPVGQAASSAHVSYVHVQPSGIPPFCWMQRPSAPDVHCGSASQAPCGPPPPEGQSPAGAGAVHSLSLGRWLVGAGPASTPPLELPLEDPELPLDPPLELPELPELLPDELPLEEPELLPDPDELPELDELPPSAPDDGTLAVWPPHAHSTATATIAPSLRRIVQPPDGHSSNLSASGPVGILARSRTPRCAGRVGRSWGDGHGHSSR